MCVILKPLNVTSHNKTQINVTGQHIILLLSKKQAAVTHLNTKKFVHEKMTYIVIKKKTHHPSPDMQDKLFPCVDGLCNTAFILPTVSTQ